MRPLTYLAVAPFLLVASMFSAGAQNSAGVSAVYKTANVSNGGDTVSLDFTVRLLNMTDGDLKFGFVRLADPANAHKFAEWTSVSIPAKGHVDLSNSVSVTANEYKRWKNGGGANLFLAAPDPMGTTRVTGVTATYQASGW